MAKLEVIFEDNHLLVLDKPALLPTMGVKPGEDSLYNRACEYLKNKYDKPGNVFLGVVHRIDSFVSGAIVFARTSKAASRLSDQFRRRVVEKKYWAIVPNHCEDEGVLEDLVFKDESRHRMVVDSKAQPVVGAKVAKLHYSTLGTARNLKLIEVELETGRKHQIRVQFENIGCSIVGDTKYGSNLPFKKGIALHSQRISFEHPTKKVIQSFESNPPIWWNVGRFSI